MRKGMIMRRRVMEMGKVGADEEGEDDEEEGL